MRLRDRARTCSSLRSAPRTCGYLKLGLYNISRILHRLPFALVLGAWATFKCSPCLPRVSALSCSGIPWKQCYSLMHLARVSGLGLG